jgi:hypothetical protein
MQVSIAGLTVEGTITLEKSFLYSPVVFFSYYPRSGSGALNNITITHINTIQSGGTIIFRAAAPSTTTATLDVYWHAIGEVA